jgi:hypothetical protein
VVARRRYPQMLAEPDSIRSVEPTSSVNLNFEPHEFAMSGIRASIAVFTGLASLLIGAALYVMYEPDLPATAIYKVVRDSERLAHEPNSPDVRGRTITR